MSKGLRILKGRFGRVALLDMDEPLIEHAHEHCHVLLKVGGGDTYFRVRDRVVPLRDDTAVLVNSWEPHSYRHVEGAPSAIILALYIEPAWLGVSSRSLEISNHPQFFPQPCVQINQQITQRATKLVDCLNQSEDVKNSEIEGLIFDVMISTITRFSDWKNLKRKSLPSYRVGDYRIRRALEYARKNISLDLGPTQLFRAAGLSRPHFFQLFRESVGITPSMFLNVLRMEEAHKMITNSRFPIGRISTELGFSAQSQFTRFFKFHQGVAPKNWRGISKSVDATQGNLNLHSKTTLGGITISK